MSMISPKATGLPRSLLLSSYARSPSSTTISRRLHTQTCRFSTAVPKFTQKAVSDLKQETALPSPPPLKKHKVELRPAPVKTPKPQVSAGPPPPQPVLSSTAAEALKSSKPDESHTTVSPEKTESAKGTTSRDFEVASQHGILAPPPEDASRLYKLFHQAKELFVRPVELLSYYSETNQSLVEILFQRPQTHQHQPDSGKRDA